MSQIPAAVEEIQADYGSEPFESICAQLTVDQLRFVTARFNCSTDKEAAREIGVSPDTVTYWKRAGAPIDDAVKLLAFDGVVLAKEILRRSIAEASAVKRAGLKSDSERIRQDAATEILDRGLGKPRQGIEHSGPDGGPIVVTAQELTDDELARIAAGGSPGAAGP